MIKFRCAECGKPYSVKSELAGKTIKCKKCGRANTLPLPDTAETEFGFFDSLSEAVDESQMAVSLPPKRQSSSNNKQKNKSKSIKSSRAPKVIFLEYLIGGVGFLGLIPLIFMFRYSAQFFALFVFFSGICIAATVTKAEKGDRWSIPGIGFVSGYTVMMLFAAAAVRNFTFAIDFIILGIGLAVFINSRSILGVSIITGTFFLQILVLTGTFGNSDVLFMDPDIRRCHLQANFVCLSSLLSGYFYSILPDKIFLTN